MLTVLTVKTICLNRDPTPWSISVFALSEKKDGNDQFLHSLVEAYYTLNSCMVRLCYESTRSYVTKYLNISHTTIPRTHFVLTPQGMVRLFSPGFLSRVLSSYIESIPS